MTARRRLISSLGLHKDCQNCPIWQDRCHRMSMDYQEIRKVCDKLLWENMGLKDDLQASNCRFEVVIKENVTSKQQIEDMKNRAKWREIQIYNKVEEEIQLRERIETLRVRVSDSMKMLDTYKSETTDLAADLNDARQKEKELRKSMNDSRAAIDHITEEHEHLKGEHEELNKKYVTALEERDSVNRDHEILKREHEGLHKEKDSIEEKYTTLKENYDALVQENFYDSKSAKDYKILRPKHETLRQEHRKLKKEYSEQFRKQKQEIVNLTRECRVTKSELETINRDYLALQEKYNKETVKNAVISERENRLMSDMRQMQKHRETTEKETEIHLRRAFTAAAELHEFKIAEHDPLRHELGRVQQSIRQQRLENDELKRDLERLQKEKSSLRRRISQLATSKLEESNHGLPDLPEDTRPTKLADMYTDLYDNGWTEALKEQVSVFYKQEVDAIDTLLHILLKIHSVCKKFSWNYLNSLTSAASIVPGRSDLLLCKVDPEGDAPAHLFKTLRQVRKLMTPFILQQISKDLDDVWEQDNISLDTNTSIYIRKCLELCWEMSVKDPPVVLMTTPAVGSRVDKDNYRFYTQSGPLVDYVVWPVMLLHKDGPTLAKGVLQGRGGEEQTVDFN